MLLLQRLVIALSILVLAGCFPNNNASSLQEVLVQGHTMGTTYNIKVVVDGKSFDSAALKVEVDKLLGQVNASMSTYQSDSELSLINASQNKEGIELSPQLAQVLSEAIRLGEISQGKLDVTVGPLVNLWGFGPQYKVEQTPTNEELKLARTRIGLDKIELTNGVLTKLHSEVYIDLSTIAKGYGVDVVAELLESKGINRYLVEIGGEMRLKGFKANGTLWHVAIEKPQVTERAVHQVLVPQDNAVATSGDYRNYFEKGGQRFSHIIDPHTGKPINHKLVSVTVIHPSAMTADGLSTMLMVMGEEEGLAFAEANEIAAYFIRKTENGFVEQSTVKFMPYLK